MLTAADFAKLDDFPGENRISQLPLWATRYERELRRLASWWHERRRGVPSWSCPVPAVPTYERMQTLPLWAEAWFRTLAFEVHWWKDKVQAPAMKHREDNPEHRQLTGAAS